jgi:hypothetical protein
MNWLNKLKEYAPSIASAVLSGGATLPQLALKAISDATGVSVSNETDLANMVESASPETMLKLKQANNSFIIRMRELDNELVNTELSDTQDARKNHKHSYMPSIICVILTLAVIAFTSSLMVFVIPESNTRIIDTLFGAFLTAWLSSISYWVGTTRTSADKDARK